MINKIEDIDELLIKIETEEASKLSFNKYELMLITQALEFYLADLELEEEK